MTYTEEQQQLISDLKKQVAECRKQYTTTKQWCFRSGNADLWPLIEPAIVAKAGYYKAEILRARHNIARYMLGREPLVDPYPGFCLEHIDYCLGKLPQEIEMREVDYQKLQTLRQKSKDQTKIQCYEIFYNIDQQLCELSIEWLKSDTEQLTRRIYGGSV